MTERFTISSQDKHERSIMPTITDRKQHQPKLDFFILGAAKSGKSALYTYLRTHPRVFIPGMDSDFYADKMEGYARPGPVKRKVYSEIFAGAADGQLLGEASAWYFFSEQAVPTILRDSPDARFIVMLRNPVDMVRALHADYLGRQVEDEPSLQKAWELQDARAKGERIPPLCSEPWMLLYRKLCSFAPQMERLFQQVPRERLLVHIFDEFFADPKRGYERTLAFLGLPNDGRTGFERFNEHGLPRFKRLHRILALSPPFPLNRLYPPLKRTFNAFGLRPGQAVIRWTAAPKDKSSHRWLEHEFQPDIARLEAILGRDLDVWRSN